MASSTSRFDNPLPTWIREMKEEAHEKITRSNFAAACRQGKRLAMEKLIVGLWPFVDAFPKMIIRGSRHLLKAETIGDRELVNALIRRSSQTLSSIQRDEENHRTLWLETGRALGLNYPYHFDRPAMPAVKAWIEEVSKQADPFSMFLRFAAIEIIAESVSVNFLASERFTVVLGRRGIEWFRVHAEHDGDAVHEYLELRLGFAYHQGGPTKEESNSIIQQIVDLFIKAGEGCAELAGELAALPS